ncbi:dynein regulatory complex subunit 3-like [Oscarella lobularis]|uniref:dynein regulatory complex subunit 3-like n=1 Tax=Oscarella lobularis TaxID=121494 RepID=UPI00331330DA
MSRVYDAIEPTVIDDELLHECVYDQGPTGEAGSIVQREGIDFRDVSQLRLDFRNILKIDNIWMFTGLTKLQLDNNIIEKIEGLDTLVNLQWLDLSFNNIEEISGLDRLTKLEDLSLYHNRISKMENMESLVHLQVFSVGSNCLEDLRMLIYLRRFANLQTLNLSGNPFCQDPRYKRYVFAHLPQLRYLDFRLVTEDERTEAQKEYKDDIDLIKQAEAEEEKRASEEEATSKELARHKAAYVDGMFGLELFEGMYEEDQDASKLHQMPGVEAMLTSFREQFVVICNDLAEMGLKEKEKRQQECEDFSSCVEEAKRLNKEKGVQLVEQYLSYKKTALQGVHHIRDIGEQDEKIEECRAKLEQLKHELLLFEMQLVDQLEEVIKDFERSVTEMVSVFVEGVQQRMTQSRDLENAHHEKLTEIAMQLLERMVKGELEEELPDELRMLFVDKDTIANAINASHDVHVLAIDNKEDSILSRARRDLNFLVERVHREEVERNRSRTAEILHFIEHHGNEFDMLEESMHDARS